MRSIRLAAAFAIFAVFVSACGAGPSSRPVVAVVQGNPGSESTTSTPGQPEPQVPELDKIKTDLDWRDCTRPILDLMGYGPGPAGLILECADFTTEKDASGQTYGTFSVGVLRARMPQTPLDVAPLVLTSGADRSSSATLAGLASGPASAMLAARPVVAIDRRGIGNSSPFDCVPPDARRGLADLGQFTGGDPVERIAEFSEAATISCKDFLQPQELAFGAPNAADDLEALRMQWQVDKLAVLGSGNGAKVALGYAAKYPQHVGRLILDAPESTGTDAATAAEQRIQGAEAAVTAFSTRCIATNCVLGPDPRAAIVDLVNRARGGTLGAISANSLLTAISGFLGSPRSDQPNRIADLADALSAAAGGDTSGLDAIVQREAAMTDSDGQYITRCSDGQQWPPPEKVRSLQQDWGTKYPIFGPEAALELLVCTTWPVVPPPANPTDLKLPVLVLSGAADPVVGNGGIGSITGALGAAGGKVAAMTWQGWGHPVAAHSGCAQSAVIEYVASGKLPTNGAVCPA